MDVRARRLERIRGHQSHPRGALNLVVRLRLAARHVVPVRKLRKRVIVPDFSKEIAAMNQRMVVLADELAHRQKDMESYEKNLRQKPVRVRTVTQVDTTVADARRAEVEREIATLTKKVADAKNDLGMLDKEYLSSVDQIQKVQNELKSLQGSRDMLSGTRSSIQKENRGKEKTLAMLDKEIEKKTADVIALSGEMDNFRQRMRDLRTYERRIVLYYKEASLTLKI